MKGQTVEVKAACQGCPEKLYDTISAFSNQNNGGTFVFGLDEKSGFAKVGVYDAQDLERKVMEYCEQMTPVVRPQFTEVDEDGLTFVSAEIPLVLAICLLINTKKTDAFFLTKLGVKVRVRFVQERDMWSTAVDMIRKFS